MKPSYFKKEREEGGLFYFISVLEFIQVLQLNTEFNYIFRSLRKLVSDIFVNKLNTSKELFGYKL